MRGRIAAARGERAQARKHLQSAIDLQEFIISVCPDSEVKLKRLKSLRAQLQEINTETNNR